MTELGDYLRAQKAAGFVWVQQAELDALRASPRGQLIVALKMAIGHIDHMAVFIGKQEERYSFESLGEDLPGFRALVAGSTFGIPLVKIDEHRASEDGETVGWRYIVSPFLSYWVGEVSRDLFENSDCAELGDNTGIFLVRFDDLNKMATIIARCPDWDRGREVAAMLSGAEAPLTVEQDKLIQRCIDYASMFGFTKEEVATFRALLGRDTTPTTGPKDPTTSAEIENADRIGGSPGV